MTTIQINECYICTAIDDKNYIKPCNTINCSAICHESCLLEQIKISNDKLCGLCRQSIVENISKIYYLKCLNNYCCKFIKILYILIILFGGYISNVFLALGYNYNIKKDGDNIYLILLFTIFYMCIYMQGPIIGLKYNIFLCNNYKKMRFKSYLTMLVMFLISNILILCSHIIGSIIILTFNHKYEFFTSLTSIYGSILYILIVLFCMFIFGLCKLYELIKYKLVTEYSQISYGTTLIDELKNISNYGN